MRKHDYDVIVAGAGVAGLAAATAAARAGARTLILDAAPEIAAKVKGEVIKQKNTIIQKMLGKPLPEWMINGVSARRRIFSPSCRKSHVVQKDAVSLLIEYRPLAHSLAKACIESGAILQLNTRISKALVDENEQVIGVRCEISGREAEIRSKVVIAADGWNSLLRRQMNLSAPIVCPAYKAVVEGMRVADEDMLEFLLLNEPAGVLWIFPKGRTSAECGITYWDDSANAKQADLQAVWERHRNEHPILKERLRSASPVLTSVDGLIFGGVLQDFVRPGLVLVGDAAGHVGSSGGSGILSSLNMGYEAGSFLGAFAAQNEAPPDLSIMLRCMEVMKSTETWQMLQSEEKSGALTRHFLFKVLQTNQEIDNAWDAISQMA